MISSSHSLRTSWYSDAELLDFSYYLMTLRGSCFDLHAYVSYTYLVNSATVSSAVHSLPPTQLCLEQPNVARADFSSGLVSLQPRGCLLSYA